MNKAKPLFMREALKRQKDPIVYIATVPAHFGGGYGLVDDKIRRTGNKHWLISFPYLLTNRHNISKSQKDLLQILIGKGCHVFLDSGAHTFQNFKLKPTTGRVSSYDLLFKTDDVREEYLKRFIAYCLEHGSKFDCYANFDYWPSAKLIYDMQKRLESEGIFPFPVEHGDDGFDWFNKYIDEGYNYFGISKTLRWGSRDRAMTFFERVFNIAEKRKVLLHGFAVTDIELLLRFPWATVDSSTWMKVSAYGGIVSVNEGRVTPIHVTRSKVKRTVTNIDMSWLENTVTSRGFDFELMQYFGEDKPTLQKAWHERAMYNIYVLTHLREFGARTSGESKWKSLLNS